MSSPEKMPWSERLFVSTDEAAQILDRSPAWVRDAIAEARLEGRRLTPSGPISVTVQSLRTLAAQAEPAVPPLRRRKLVLVVDNG